MQRFCRYLAEEYRLQKLANISGKHLVAYVRHLQENGKGGQHHQDGAGGDSVLA